MSVRKASTSSGESNRTTDHGVIQQWVEKRGGKPAVVASTKKGDSGLLRIKFQENGSNNLEEIEWDQFFKIFNENDLEFLYQEKTLFRIA